MKTMTQGRPTWVLILGLSLVGCSSGKTASGGSDKGGAGGASEAGAGGASDGGTVASNGGASAGGAAVTTCSAEEAALEPTLFEADHEFIQYMGRVDRDTDPKRVKFSAPGVTVSAKFRGSSVTVHLHDEFGNTKNYYDVLVDGKRIVALDADVATWSIRPTLTGDTYPIKVKFECGDHTVSVVKRTEASIGYGEFIGFEVAKLLEPDPLPTRRIEVIGDSITAGAGAEGANGTALCTADSWGQPANNARVTWGGDVAVGVKAQIHNAGVSGIGLIRNYSSLYDARPMPEVYDNLYFEQKVSPVLWDKSQYQPDAILIALGTNDFSPGDSDREHMNVEAFTTAYIAFVDKLHADYPDAKFFAVSSAMLGDKWPDATYTSRTDQRTALQAVAAHYAGTDVTMTYVPVSNISGAGCSSHPNVEQHAYVADREIIPVVKEVMGW